MQTQATKRADKELRAEMTYQKEVVLGLGGVALHNVYGWGGLRIWRLFEETREAWNQITDDKNLSALRHLYEETGIDLQLDGEPDWRTLAYTSGEPSKYEVYITEQQYVYMRHKQKRWTQILILAELALGLNRREGFGPDRLSRFLEEFYRLRDDVPRAVQKDAKKAAKRAHDMLMDAVEVELRLV